MVRTQVAAYLQQSRLGSDGHDLASTLTHSRLSDVGNEREMPASFGRKERGPTSTPLSPVTLETEKKNQKL